MIPIPRLPIVLLPFATLLLAICVLPGHAQDAAQIHRSARASFTGDGVPQDRPKAVRQFRQAAELGYAPSQTWYGFALLRGMGVTQQVDAGLAWMQRGAESGNVESMNEFGRALTAGWGGLAKNPRDGCHWFRRAAAAGHAAAMASVGLCHREGWDGPRDAAAAVEWFRRGADLNEPSGHYLLAQSYRDGNGVPKDPALAALHMKQAAAVGYVHAQRDLGVMYTEGMGVAVDPVRANTWFHKAAQQGDAWSMFRLGWSFEHGQGVAKDPLNAMAWYKAADTRGYAPATERMRALAIGLGDVEDLPAPTFDPEPVSRDTIDCGRYGEPNRTGRGSDPCICYRGFWWIDYLQTCVRAPENVVIPDGITPEGDPTRPDRNSGRSLGTLGQD